MAECYPFDRGELPPAIYFDTSFLILAALEPNQDKRWEAKRFLNHLRDAETFVMLSDLVILECAHASLKLLLIDKYGKDGWYEMAGLTAIRRQFMPKVIEAMAEIDKVISMFVDTKGERKLPGGEVVRLEGQDISRAAQNMQKYALMSYDATHLSVMQSYGIQDIATTDGDFLDVDYLKLWLPVSECERLRRR
ncbi:MAG: type II toxin-antitoxin system VapC family toxin [Chloroflexota bacterium]